MAAEGLFSAQVTRVRNLLANGDQGRMLEYFAAVGVFIDTLSSGMVIPVLPSFATRFNKSQSITTFLLALRGTTAIAFAFPTSFLIARFGHKNVLFFSFVGTVVASVLLAFPLYFPFLGFALFLQGLCSELAWTAGLSLGALIYGGGEGGRKKRRREERQGPDGGDLGKPLLLGESQNGLKGEKGDVEREGQEGEERGDEGDEREGEEGSNGLVGAVGVLFTMSSFGYLLGPFCGAVLYQYTAFWVPFTIVAIMTLLMGIALLILVTDRDLFSGKANVERAEVEEGGPTSHEILSDNDVDSEGETLMEAFLAASSDGTIVLMLTVSVITLVQFGEIEVLLPFFLQKTCGRNIAEIGLVFGVASVAFGLASAQAEKFVDRFGSTSCILLGLVFQALSSPALFVGHATCSLFLQCVFMTVAGSALAFSMTPCFPLIVKVFKKLGFGNYTVVVAMYNTSFTLGSALGPLFAAGLIIYMSSFMLIGIFSVLMILSAPLVWLGREAPSTVSQLS